MNSTSFLSFNICSTRQNKVTSIVSGKGIDPYWPKLALKLHSFRFLRYFVIYASVFFQFGTFLSSDAK